MIRYVVFILMMVGAGYGALMALTAFANGTSAIHEIEGLIAMLIVTVAMGCWYVGTCVDGLRPKQPPQPYYPPPPPPQ